MKSKLELFQLEYILNLVERQDVVDILNQENLIASFNELFEYELVELADAKILLTVKGKEAQTMGLENYLLKYHADSPVRKASFPGKPEKGN